MAFRTKKISQMDPKGSNLASTDLLEISQLVSGSYVTKSITGAQIAASAPATAWGTITGTLSSQTDLNTALSGKQATVTLTTTGTGAATFVSNVLNVPTPAAATFSSLTTTGSSGASTLTSGVLNVPTYSLSGLGGVPTSRTLTINGTTQDLSADRTFTISTGITIGTTAITSGTVGRVLFEGTGNVVSESANLFWDNTNGRLGIGSATPLTALSVNSLRPTISIRDTTGSTNSSYFGSFDDFLQIAVNRNPSTGVFTNTGKASAQISMEGSTSSGKIFFYATNTNGATPLEAMRINGTGNVLINTTTDAGFKLDVNGTARVVNLLTASGGTTLSGTNNLTGLTSITGFGSGWFCQYASNATVKPFGFSLQGGGTASPNNTAIQFGFNFREAGGLFTQDIFQNILYDNSGSSVTGFEWFTHQNQAPSATSVLAMSLRGKTLSLGTNTPNASSLMQMDSTTQGFLPPRQTQAQRTAIASPAVGLVVFQTDATEGLYIYKSTGWALLL
jgi:hypothetical protein